MRRISKRSFILKSAINIPGVGSALEALMEFSKGTLRGDTEGYISKLLKEEGGIGEVISALKNLNEEERVAAMAKIRESNIPEAEKEGLLRAISEDSELSVGLSSGANTAGQAGARTAEEIAQKMTQLKNDIKNNPNEFLEQYATKTEEDKESLKTFWRDHSGEEKDLEDYARSLIEGDSAVTTATSVKETAEEARGLTSELAMDTKLIIKSDDSLESIFEKLSKRQSELMKEEAEVILKIMRKNPEEFLKKVDEYSDLEKVLLRDSEFRAIMDELATLIEGRPESFARRLVDVFAGTPEVKAQNVAKSKRLYAGIAAGLGGAALVSYILFGRSSGSGDPTAPIPTSPGPTPPGPTPPQTTRGGGLGYQEASLIMKSKGYLSSVQQSWTSDFDSAFRDYIDAGSSLGRVRSNLASGQDWSAVAGSLGFAPNKTGAFEAIKYYESVVPNKGAGGTSAIPTVTPPAPISIPGEDYPVLAAIIGAMYNQKLVGTPGFDLVKEPKRIQALVDAVGGASPEGYGNAARVIAKMNPSIVTRLPKELTGPIDQAYAKNPANKALLQTIQVAINRIYESAVSGSKTLGINPLLGKSTELVSAWLRSPAGGNWKDKTSSNNQQQWVKLANERKMRIRAEIAAEMTPAERAAARRTKMREAV